MCMYVCMYILNETFTREKKTHTRTLQLSVGILKIKISVENKEKSNGEKK